MSLLSDTGTGDSFALPDRMPGAPRSTGSANQPGHLRHERHSITVFGGIVTPAEGSAQTISYMTGLTPRAYPALSVATPHPLYANCGTQGRGHGLTIHRDQLICIRGTELYSMAIGGSATSGTPVLRGKLTDTDKQFASFGDLLFILPDRAVYDASTGLLTSIPADTGELTEVSISGSYLTAPGATLLTLGLRAGDCIRLEIIDHLASATLDGYYRLTSVTETMLGVKGSFPGTGTFTLRIRRVMPDLEGICAMGDRLFGFCGQTIYATEAGNPKNWYATRGLSEEEAPFSLTTAGDSPFTACTIWQGYPLFFKEDGIDRLCGRVGAAGKLLSATAAVLDQQSAPGIPARQRGCICELGGALFYASGDRLYRYSGGYPVPISQALPDGSVVLHMGTDGQVLYASVRESDQMVWLYLYSPDRGWYRLEQSAYTGILTIPVELTAEQGKVCVLLGEDGALYPIRSGGRALSTSLSSSAVSTTAMVEWGDDLSLLPDGGRLLAVHIRAIGRGSSRMALSVSYDGGGWTTLGKLSGTGHEVLYHVPVPPRPCHWFRLRLTFSGQAIPGATDGVFRVSGLWWDTERRVSF